MTDRATPTAEGFAARHGYKASGSHICLRRIAGGRHLGGIDGCDGCVHRRYLDHARTWTKDGSVACITSEPYGISDEDIAELCADAERFGFEFWISGGSWHYPGATVLIEIRPMEGHQKEHAVRLQVCAVHGIPSTLADSLHGTTPHEWHVSAAAHAAVARLRDDPDWGARLRGS